MHSTDTAYCYRRGGVVCVCLSACVGQNCQPRKTAEHSRMPFVNRLAWAKEPLTDRYECILAPPDEYDSSICAAAAMRPAATITVATCSSLSSSFSSSSFTDVGRYTVSQKLHIATFALTLPNIDRFSNYFTFGFGSKFIV